MKKLLTIIIAVLFALSLSGIAISAEEFAPPRDTAKVENKVPVKKKAKRVTKVKKVKKMKKAKKVQKGHKSGPARKY